jgi:aconitate hydratase 2/2-methylisocitrate dehydratase
MEEYKSSVEGIDLTSFTPVEEAMTTKYDAAQAVPVKVVS